MSETILVSETRARLQQIGLVNEGGKILRLGRSRYVVFVFETGNFSWFNGTGFLSNSIVSLEQILDDTSLTFDERTLLLFNLPDLISTAKL